MKNEISNAASHFPNISADAHFDFKLDGWPASAVLITVCLSGVIIYGIKVWREANLLCSASVAS